MFYLHPPVELPLLLAPPLTPPPELLLLVLPELKLDVDWLVVELLLL